MPISSQNESKNQKLLFKISDALTSSSKTNGKGSKGTQSTGKESEATAERAFTHTERWAVNAYLPFVFVSAHCCWGAVSIASIANGNEYEHCVF